jgi:hypothetical protein
MSDERIVTWPVKHHGPFSSDQVDPEHLRKLLSNYPVLHHFVWSCNPADVVESTLVRTALLMAEFCEGHNTDTNLALRKLLEARELHRYTWDRTLLDNPGVPE